MDIKACWHDLPFHYGHWWCKLGIFEKILQIVDQNAEDSSRSCKNSTDRRTSSLSEKAIELFEKNNAKMLFRINLISKYNTTLTRKCTRNTV